ncbi:MAG: GTP-binding protein [Chitinivibrionales bacterium]|nr:GTP-binding protein [Chitinivibrionales bacterium]
MQGNQTVFSGVLVHKPMILQLVKKMTLYILSKHPCRVYSSFYHFQDVGGTMPEIATEIKGIKLRSTLKGNTSELYGMKLSPDARLLMSPSKSGELLLWENESGHFLGNIFTGLKQPVCLGWSPDSRTVAFGDRSRALRFFDVMKKRIISEITDNTHDIEFVKWSPDGKYIATGGNDRSLCIWNFAHRELLHWLSGHANKVTSASWSPDSRRLCSGGWDNKVSIWEVESTQEQYILQGHLHSVNDVAWSPDNTLLASASDDTTVRIWEPDSGRQTHVLEAHTDWVVSVVFLQNGRLLGSLSEKGTVILWDTRTWAEVARFDQIGNTDFLSDLILDTKSQILITRNANPTQVDVWDINLDELLQQNSAASVIHYVNAKAVLVGDAGVGKSGLGIRIAEKTFYETKSTHGAKFWQIPISNEQIGIVDQNTCAELTLWDFAGQAEYRLVHQLFLDDTDIALLLFDCSDAHDPFRGVSYWAKAIKNHVPQHALKLLVSSRIDVSPVTVDAHEINLALTRFDLDRHFQTSAATSQGVNELVNFILTSIPWDRLPKTTTPRLFELIRCFILTRKEMGVKLVDVDTIRQEIRNQYDDGAAYEKEIDTVISLLQARGIIYRVTLNEKQDFILTCQDILNQYASSAIQAARNHARGIGAIAERDVLTANIPLDNIERLTPEQEKIVLESTVELLIRHDLCFREMGFLVFPTQINVTRPELPIDHPPTEISYRFSGGIESIYASLVVQLSYTGYFQLEDQWKYAVEFSRNSKRLGFSMRQIEEGTGELGIYFYSNISDSDRITFTKFVTAHLNVRGINIERHFSLVCSCGKRIEDDAAIATRVKAGKLDIPCQYCGRSVMIPRSIEERYDQNIQLKEKQQELVETVSHRTQREVKEFRKDQQQYTSDCDKLIYILHLSDLHIDHDKEKAFIYRSQLQLDLHKELGINRLDYLVISGDIANKASPSEYKIAVEFVDGLLKGFGISSDKAIIVPGNHDVDWEESKKAYPFYWKSNLPEHLDPGRTISAGEAGVLMRDDQTYFNRFENFNSHFYKKVYRSHPYPLEYSSQGILHINEDDKMLFLGLNSSWHIDHHFKTRAEIHKVSLHQAIEKMQNKYDDWLKIAVLHHPVSVDGIADESFMDSLSVCGFKMCMHGHVHKAAEGHYAYDDHRKIHCMGAGTFGAPSKHLQEGVPRQYQLIVLDPNTGEVSVQTRKRAGHDGAWMGDALWQDKNNPKPHYTFSIN